MLSLIPQMQFDILNQQALQNHLIQTEQFNHFIQQNQIQQTMFQNWWHLNQSNQQAFTSSSPLQGRVAKIFVLSFFAITLSMIAYVFFKIIKDYATDNQSFKR